jgi:WD40 repeat protein
MVFAPNSTYHAVSPNGKWIVRYTGGNPENLQVRCAKTGLLAATFGAHRDKIRTVGFSQDSKQILAASHDGIIHVYTLAC